MPQLTEWLMQGPAWVQYRTRRDLLKQKENHPDVIAARQAMLADPQVKSVIKQLEKWDSTVITSHKSAGHPLHQLAFLADLGLHADDPGADTDCLPRSYQPIIGDFKKTLMAELKIRITDAHA